jgi:hypothetical protein
MVEIAMFARWTPSFDKMTAINREAVRVFRRLLAPLGIAGVLVTGIVVADGVAGAALSPAAVKAGPVAAASQRTPRHDHHHFSGKASPRLGIRHVFVIVLENESFADAYQHNPNHYLGRRLQRQGTLLAQYYATGHESNDNYLAMISGQAPSVATQADCADYVDFQPRPAPLDKNGQAIGAGCVYPRNVLTLANQLSAKGVSWRGYMEDMGNDETREPSRCGEPTSSAGTGMPDGTQKAEATDQYAARHNPFVYFHSLIDSGACHRHVVPLTHLAYDLRHAKTPRFAFITPNLCDDGHDAQCTGTNVKGTHVGGLTAVDYWLKRWVPRIEHSPGFAKHDLLLITSDESETSDTASCCNEQAGPNSPRPGITGMGGGRIGALAIGRCVQAGAVDHRPYNHYSLLRSLEDLFGVRHGGSDGKGHLGFAGAEGLRSFGPDLFDNCPRQRRA